MGLPSSSKAAQACMSDAAGSPVLPGGTQRDAARPQQQLSRPFPVAGLHWEYYTPACCTSTPHVDAASYQHPARSMVQLTPAPRHPRTRANKVTWAKVQFYRCEHVYTRHISQTAPLHAPHRPSYASEISACRLVRRLPAQGDPSPNNLASSPLKPSRNPSSPASSTPPLRWTLEVPNGG